ncbi:hypothetical protein [Pseudomonas savastanoi]|uniref:hypothetical protein n=1 Tax=Pseudomonas savastanoi TaxID=29438 RepID=UPI0013C34A68|nr:hypothetical protein [Pseudomonas savastanoi]
MKPLREQLLALDDAGLARLVMVAAEALNDQNWIEEIAELCAVPRAELEEWSVRVVWGDNNQPGLQHAAAITLGFYPAPENTGAEEGAK